MPETKMQSAPVISEPTPQAQMANPQIKKPCCRKKIWLGIGLMIIFIWLGILTYLSLTTCIGDAMRVSPNNCITPSLWQKIFGKNLKQNNQVNLTMPLPLSSSDQTTDWKTYTAKNLGIIVNYPAAWFVSENLIDESQKNNNYTLRITDTKDSWTNSIIVYQKPPTVNKQFDSIEQFSEKYIQWTMSYIPGVSYNSPEIIKKEPIIISNLTGYKFLLKFNKKDNVDYDYYTEVYLFNQQNEYQYTIILAGNNQVILNQILSTFKFTE